MILHQSILRRLVFGPAVLTLLGVAAPQALAASITLGSAGNFAMFADVTEGSSGTTNIDLNAYTLYGGIGAPTIAGAAPNQYFGNIYTGNSSQPAGTLNSGYTYFPNSGTIISNAQADAATASNQLAALVATQTINGDLRSGTITGNGGVNVINLNGSITGGFKVSGGASDIFVFNVTGTLNFNSGIAADISGTGVTASHIIYNFIGTTPNQIVNTMVPDTIYGTLLSTNGNYHFTLDSDVYGGAIDLYNGTTAIRGMSVQNQFGTGNFFTGVPTFAVPEPSSLMMGSIAALSGLGYLWRRSRICD